MPDNIREIIQQKISSITDIHDFNEAIEQYKQSQSGFKYEAIKMLENAFPIFSDCSMSVENAKKIAQESQPDYSDIGN